LSRVLWGAASAAVWTNFGVNPPGCVQVVVSRWFVSYLASHGVRECCYLCVKVQTCLYDEGRSEKKNQ
jgi:hypothetical protein